MLALKKHLQPTKPKLFLKAHMGSWRCICPMWILEVGGDKTSSLPYQRDYGIHGKCLLEIGKNPIKENGEAYTFSRSCANCHLGWLKKEKLAKFFKISHKFLSYSKAGSLLGLFGDRGATNLTEK